MADSPRIEQLLRRVRADPASIAFAALAEEYRKNGRYPEAIEVCRMGLQRHPAYLSARVTLGRALVGLGDYDAARLELEAVLRVAPENLAAIRAMADIYSRLQEMEDMPAEDAEPANPMEPDGAEEQISAVPAALDPMAPKPAPLRLASFEPGRHRDDDAIERLERFLAAITAARANLSSANSRPAPGTR